ncbi:hypothetical protein HQ865_22365 [Mucilaginibacter mali]|uniref:Fungal lipase-type domain-containing protein n=1 Tax=Mucilaginibacter mali TaxID=2740462 RepID=A0A7D4Q6H2_9SPHI|nr:hypothetical protein [Mucilaginibacter mali]QKJ32387.1 hypothetical protein HQ865_22365 [Mucilaginibacter mali]
MKISSRFNFVQQVFALNMFSNLASDKKGTDHELTHDLNTLLQALLANADMQKFMDNWVVVWGPVVGSYGMDAKNPKREVVTNAMYVAANDKGQYVVAVSATNPVSKYGWLVEDFDVRTMVAWKELLEPGIQTEGETVCISNGTAVGLQHLLTLRDQTTGTTLIDYLKFTFAQTPHPVTLAVSGHSLGGAQSSVLALYLDQTLHMWNPDRKVVVSAMPTAGASPGNKAFSDHHSYVMGTRTLRFWNKLDPVPHGWEPNMVEQVPFLYYPYLQPGALLKGIAAGALSQSLIGSASVPNGGYYTQLQPQTPPLPGQVGITQTRAFSAAEIVQAIFDIGIDEVLQALKITGEAAQLIKAQLNVYIEDIANEQTLDELLDELEAYIIGKYGAEGRALIQILEVLFLEIENVALFLAQLALQHVTYYPDLMGTANMHALSQAIINNLVNAGALDDSYTNRMDTMFDPRRGLNLFVKLGEMILKILTPDFLKANGMGQLLS